MPTRDARVVKYMKISECKPPYKQPEKTNT